MWLDLRHSPTLRGEYVGGGSNRNRPNDTRGGLQVVMSGADRQGFAAQSEETFSPALGPPELPDSFGRSLAPLS